MKLHLIFFIFISSFLICSCSKNLFPKLIENDKELLRIVKDKKEYEVQIRYTQIKRDAKGKPIFKSYDYNVDPLFYFYPASTIKMPIAFMAIQRVNEIAKATGKDISIYTPIYHYAIRKPQSDQLIDDLTKQAPTVANYIDQIFCTSDNNASNRLFELLGAEYLNEELYKKGAFTTSHINHRVGISGFEPEDHEYVNEIKFKDQKEELLYKIEGRKSIFKRKHKLRDTAKGKGYIDSKDSLISTPFDFSKKNFFNIIDLEACMKRALFHEVFDENEKYGFKEEDYKFLKRSMSLLPKDLPYFAQDTHYYDTYVKYFFDGDQKSIIPPHIKIYNKVGWAYGYLTDCSYIVDEKEKLEYFLTATIKVNKDGIFNDGVYEYDEVGLPFFRALGKVIRQHELERKK